MSQRYMLITLVLLLLLALTGGANGIGVKQVTSAPLSDGGTQIWAIDVNDQLWSCWKQTTDSSSGWTDWNQFPMPPAADVQQISAAPLSDGRLQLWAIDGNNKLWTCWKETTDVNSAWTDWVEDPINNI